jgi:hypothetical protein
LQLTSDSVIAPSFARRFYLARLQLNSGVSWQHTSMNGKKVIFGIGFLGVLLVAALYLGLNPGNLAASRSVVASQLGAIASSEIAIAPFGRSSGNSDRRVPPIALACLAS